MAEKTLKQKLSELVGAISETDNTLHEITEKKANKVNSFSAAIDDTISYPTVKAVKDYIGDTGTGLATKDYVDSVKGDILGGAGTAFDTLQELAEALGEDENFSTTVMTELGKKSDKTTTISAGTGLTGGGSLASNRTISLSQATRDDITKGVQGHAHISKKDNPHNVTKAQVGLGNVDNTSDVNKPVSTAQGQAINSVQNDLNNYKDIIGHAPFPNYREMYLNLLDLDTDIPVQPLGVSLAISSTSHTQAPSACGFTLDNILYYDGESTGISVGDKLYTDSQLTNTFSAFDGWYFTDNGKVVKVDTNGYVIGVTFCSTEEDEDDNPSSPEAGRQLRMSTESNTVHDQELSHACSYNTNVTRYYDGGINVAVGDKVFNDPLMSVPFEGRDRYYMTTQGKTVRINNSGQITALGTCGSEWVPEPF